MMMLGCFVVGQLIDWFNDSFFLSVSRPFLHFTFTLWLIVWKTKANHIKGFHCLGHCLIYLLTMLPLRQPALRAATKFLHSVRSLSSGPMVPQLWPRSCLAEPKLLDADVWDLLCGCVLSSLICADCFRFTKTIVWTFEYILYVLQWRKPLINKIHPWLECQNAIYWRRQLTESEPDNALGSRRSRGTTSTSRAAWDGLQWFAHHGISVGFAWPCAPLVMHPQHYHIYHLPASSQLGPFCP